MPAKASGTKEPEPQDKRDQKNPGPGQVNWTEHPDEGSAVLVRGRVDHVPSRRARAMLPNEADSGLWNWWPWIRVGSRRVTPSRAESSVATPKSGSLYYGYSGIAA